MGIDQFWSLDDRLMYLIHTRQMESEEFLCYLKIYGRPRIARAYQEYKAQGSTYAPKPVTGAIHQAPNSVKPQAKAEIKKEDKKTATYSRYHPAEADDDF